MPDRPRVIFPAGEFEYQIANQLIQRQTRWLEHEDGAREKISELTVVDFAMLPPGSFPDSPGYPATNGYGSGDSWPPSSTLAAVGHLAEPVVAVSIRVFRQVLLVWLLGVVKLARHRDFSLDLPETGVL